MNLPEPCDPDKHNEFITRAKVVKVTEKDNPNGRFEGYRVEFQIACGVCKQSVFFKGLQGIPNPVSPSVDITGTILYAPIEMIDLSGGIKY